MAPRLVATQLLTRVIDDHRNLDALCDKQHGLEKFRSLGSKDQLLARAIALAALRNRNHIEAALKSAMKRSPPRNARFLIHSLHVAVAQILFLEVPDSAAVNLAVSAIGNDKRTTRFRALTNAILRKITKEKHKHLQNEIDQLPNWLKARLRSDYGKENAHKIGRAISQQAPLDVSVKSDPEVWAEKLNGVVLKNGTVRLNTNTSVIKLPGYDDGMWWVQDAAAAIPAKLLGMEPPAKILELCAAPGGKTAQLATAGYQVTAVDISKPRLKRLKENLDRLNLEALIVEADIMKWQPDTLFDAVLLDAPCSSTGTIRRHPDVMWTRTPQEVSELANLQRNLLLRAATFLKPNGTLVFSNCSILKEEGENMLAGIVQSDPGLKLVSFTKDEVFGMEELINGQGALRCLPYHMESPSGGASSGMDGFFACRFQRLTSN